MKGGADRYRVMAIGPAHRAFGYVIFEGPFSIVDWGVKSVRSTTIEREINMLSKINDLLHHYRVRVLIIEQIEGPCLNRCGRIRLLLATLKNQAAWGRVKVRTVSRKKKLTAFRAFGASTKDEIAQVIGRLVPELAPSLPRKRKAWMAEDYRAAIFDAAALALTFYYTKRLCTRTLRS